MYWLSRKEQTQCKTYWNHNIHKTRTKWNPIWYDFMCINAYIITFRISIMFRICVSFSQKHILYSNHHHDHTPMNCNLPWLMISRGTEGRFSGRVTYVTDALTEASPDGMKPHKKGLRREECSSAKEAKREGLNRHEEKKLKCKEYDFIFMYYIETIKRIKKTSFSNLEFSRKSILHVLVLFFIFIRFCENWMKNGRDTQHRINEWIPTRSPIRSHTKSNSTAARPAPLPPQSH